MLPAGVRFPEKNRLADACLAKTRAAMGRKEFPPPERRPPVRQHCPILRRNRRVGDRPSACECPRWWQCQEVAPQGKGGGYEAAPPPNNRVEVNSRPGQLSQERMSGFHLGGDVT